MEVYVKDGDEYTPLPEDFKVLSNDDLTKNYLTKAEHSAGVKAAVDDRFKNHVHKDKVFEDEVLVARFHEKFGGKKDDLDLDAQRAQWATANLKPVQDELEDTRGKLGALTGKLKHVEIERAFEEKFEDTFTGRIDPKKPSLAELYFDDQIDFDYNTTTISVKGSEMTVEQFVDEVYADERFAKYRKKPDRNDTRAKINQDGTPVTKSGQKPKSQADIQDVAAYARQYGLRKPKVEGWPAYFDLN